MTVELAWREDGSADAPPLVLLNSIGSSTAMWEPCVAPLAEQFRVLRIDTRGHGDSPPSAAGSTTTIADLADDVLAVLDRLGLRRVSMAGLSLGGMVTMHIAAHHPQRVSRIALLCSSAHLMPLQLWIDRAATVRADGMGALADAAIARWITPAFAERDPATSDAIHTMFAAVDPESYAQCAEAIGAMDQRRDLARIASATLIINASEDPATPLEHQQVLADGIPGSRLEVVAGASHVATYEQPARVAALLIDHFRAGGTLAGGYAVRREVLGDEYVDAALRSSTELTDGFQRFLTRYAWGEVWTDSSLARRDRSIATLAALVTLGAEHELAAHVHGAIRNGLTPAEVIDVVQHVSIYAGMPRANRAVAIARDVLQSD